MCVYLKPVFSNPEMSLKEPDSESLKRPPVEIC